MRELMSARRRVVRVFATVLLGLGLVLPTVAACSSPSEAPEQVEQTGDLEETDPEPDIEE
jgi:hypothetical protein